MVQVREPIFFSRGGLHVGIAFTPQAEPRLIHFGAQPPPATWPALQPVQTPVELQVAGENIADHHGSKYTGTLPGTRLRCQQVQEYPLPDGCRIEIELLDPVSHLAVVLALRLYDTAPVLRCQVRLHNQGPDTLTLQYLSSFALWGLLTPAGAGQAADFRLHLPHHSWNSEFQWRSCRVADLGLSFQSAFSFKRIALSATGGWPSAEHLPMGLLEDTRQGQTLFWQIEHNGSWHWEIGDKAHELYLRLSGPTERESHWWKRLAPGERFESVPVAVGAAAGGVEAAVQALTAYRRLVRQPHADQQTLPIVFNDYMNCLMGDPTTARLLPLIARAADLGCEVFTIDAGWHGDGAWWDTVGAWQPSTARFPGGFAEVIHAIRARGMLPGLWLEIEVVGVDSPLAAELPEACFFQRHGRRVIDNGRYALDFRHPRVVAHADAVIDRLVRDYGIGYFKLDFNINPGLGTDVLADSPGDGLLAHHRAWLHWLEGVQSRYPDLIIEGCASGGMRMDGAVLSRVSLQSSSDQMDYRRTARIAAASSSAVPPEQCANWVYPLADADAEAITFNVINGLLARIHVSGELAQLSGAQLEALGAGLALYRRLRAGIPHSRPVLPWGLPTTDDTWLCSGLADESRLLLAVWRLATPQAEQTIPLAAWAGWHLAETYPAQAAADCEWQAATGTLQVYLPQPYSARLYLLAKPAAV
ncbi:MAG: alpha-galactosidase [Anaerolineae bacterium]|jgi:alpha-galactosidase|nr:alpha-galactosidase [Anaerolineae bacterium]